jgi:hypothetical protein
MATKASAEHSENEAALTCNHCMWRGKYSQLLRLGSLGRPHCPNCQADYGYPDGVMPDSLLIFS